MLAAGLCPAETHAEVSGRLGIMLYSDNRQYRDNTYLEQQGTINYSDREHAFRSALAFGLRQSTAYSDLPSSENNRNSLYQLFVEKTLALPEGSWMALALGRMQRADGLGFYYLDGMTMDIRTHGWELSAYGGKPGRIEDLRGIDGKSLIGLDVSAHQAVPESACIDSLYARLGWQRYEDREGNWENRINWALRGKGNRDNRKQALLSFVDVSVNGTWLPQSGNTESLYAVLDSGWYDRLDIRLLHDTYQPDRPYVTFREKFYSIYTRGRQTTVSGEISYRLTDTQWLMFRRRQTDRESGDEGYGSSIGYRITPSPAVNWRFQYDWLDLNMDYAESYYLELNAPLAPTLRGRFGIAMQEQKKSLYGINRAAGFEIDLEKMMRADLFLRFSSTYIDNSRLQDEYRVSFHLDYYFDNRIMRVFGNSAPETE